MRDFARILLNHFSGKQRYKGGQNENPSVKEFLDNTVSLCVQGSAALEPLRGNCSRKRNAPMIVDRLCLNDVGRFFEGSVYTSRDDFENLVLL